MINNKHILNIIRRNGNFKPNKENTAYHKIYHIKDQKPIQVIISNQKIQTNDYDLKDKINYCIIFSENDNNHNNITTIPETIQYIYNCQLLNINDATLINQKIQTIRKNKKFKDPLHGTNKQAKTTIIRM